MSKKTFTFFPCLSLALPLFGLVWLLTAPALLAATPEEVSTAPQISIEFPEQFGEIVYQTNSTAATNLYIIANGHRSAFSGKNAAQTLQAQIETYRIGEWLINQNQVELLLPEGFFGNLSEPESLAANPSRLDNQSLQDSLADTSVFVNAELLLHQEYGIGLNQIEDRELYSHTRDRLRASLAREPRFSTPLNPELSYLQKYRTASLLQTAPSVVESAYQQGRISSPNAMLTIGLSHLDAILEFLEAGEISISALQTATNSYPALETKLEWFPQQVNVTIIVPRTLIKQKQAKLNRPT